MIDVEERGIEKGWNKQERGWGSVAPLSLLVVELKCDVC